MLFDDREFDVDLFVQELRTSNVDPDDLRILQTAEGHLRIRVLSDDPEGDIEQAVRSVASGHDASEKSDAERFREARGTIEDLRSVAQNYAGDVAALYAAVIAADAAADTRQERYDRIRQAVTDADAAFRTRFTQAMETETGIDIGSIGLPNLTIDQTRAVNAFARGFANSLAILLTM